MNAIDPNWTPAVGALFVRIGAAIIRRYASAEDLSALRRLWGSHVPFREWVAGALDSRGLDDDSKAMLREIRE